MELVFAVISGYLLAAVAPLVVRFARGAAGWLLALLPAALCVYFLGLIARLPEGAVTVSYPWVASLGINLSFLVDGLSLLFAILISGVGALILFYTGGYLAGHAQLGRMMAFLLMFMASMLGLVLADNVLTLFVFWELTSLSSYFLIGFDHERPAARAAALQALLVTGAGGLALLAGFVLLGQVGQQLGLPLDGSLELTSLLALGDAVRQHQLYLPILILVLGGALTKSAQFPFHFWLPGAMEAPTPVSAYLHSATMVKAGVYLLARLHPLLGGTDVWLWSLTTIGAITLLVGAWRAVGETDLKRILAYSTVAALGMLVLSLGLGTDDACAAAIVFLVAHALYKGTLFLVAGAVDHETGTRDIDLLGGLRATMPITAVVAVLAALSMAGIAPFVGFIAKELFYTATWQAPAGMLVTAVGVVASMLFVVVAVVVGVRPFFGPQGKTPKPPHEAPLGLWLGPAVLAILGVLLGVFPKAVDAQLLAPAWHATIGYVADQTLHLALWHGWNVALALSGVTLAGGFALVLARRPLRTIVSSTIVPGPEDLYHVGLVGLNRLASLQTRILQSGVLSHYLLTVLLTAVIVVGYTLLTRVAMIEVLPDWREVRFYEVGLAVLVVLATAAAVHSRSRLSAIAALGVVGYGVALIYVLYGAPDVAMTQFLVETLTVILFVLVFYHLPPGVRMSDYPVRLRDAAIGGAVGTLMAALVLVAAQPDAFPSVSQFYSEKSVAEAHGRNVVNVILVDFRSLDTLGEIVVLSVAGIGVYALLKLRPEAEEQE